MKRKNDFEQILQYHVTGTFDGSPLDTWIDADDLPIYRQHVADEIEDGEITIHDETRTVSGRAWNRQILSDVDYDGNPYIDVDCPACTHFLIQEENYKYCSSCDWAEEYTEPEYVPGAQLRVPGQTIEEFCKIYKFDIPENLKICQKCEEDLVPDDFYRQEGNAYISFKHVVGSCTNRPFTIRPLKGSLKEMIYTILGR